MGKKVEYRIPLTAERVSVMRINDIINTTIGKSLETLKTVITAFDSIRIS